MSHNSSSSFAFDVCVGLFQEQAQRRQAKGSAEREREGGRMVGVMTDCRKWQVFTRGRGGDLMKPPVVLFLTESTTVTRISMCKSGGACGAFHKLFGFLLQDCRIMALHKLLLDEKPCTRAFFYIALRKYYNGQAWCKEGRFLIRTLQEVSTGSRGASVSFDKSLPEDGRRQT